MKESKENKDNLSKIRKCIVKGEPLTDIWNEPIVGKATIEKPVCLMGDNCSKPRNAKNLSLNNA